VSVPRDRAELLASPQSRRPAFPAQAQRRHTSGRDRLVFLPAPVVLSGVSRTRIVGYDPAFPLPEWLVQAIAEQEGGAR
jgi:hypothetical protein